MERAEIETKFYNVKAENVITYVYDLIKPWEGGGIIEKAKIIYHLYKFNRPKDTRIEFMVIESTPTDKPNYRQSHVITAVVFEVWQLQHDTVQLKMDYIDFGLPVHATWKKIVAAFSKQKKPSRKKGKNCLPTTIGNARKWVVTWDLIKGRIKDDPSLQTDYYDEIRYFLKSKEITFKPETLKKIIACGKSEGIPTIKEFEEEFGA